jgi:integrase
MAEGIEVRTSKSGRKSYRASVWSTRDSKLIRKTFPTAVAARQWRRAARAQLDRGELRPPAPTTLREAAAEFIVGIRTGLITDRSGRRYKPSTIRSYERALNKRLLSPLGDRRLTDIRRPEIQEQIDKWAAGDLRPSTIRNTLDPLRAIYRRRVSREIVGINPTTALELPASTGSRDRIASAEEAARLLEALPAADRPLWATVLYAGLRRGELRALRVRDIDLGKSEIRIERTWDDVEGPVTPTSAAGSRTVPLLAILRDYLDEQILRTGRGGNDLVFGREATLPFVASTIRNDALAAWATVNDAEEEAAEKETRKPDLLDPIGLHECRHTFASLLIDAGANPKAIQEFMGHATIQMTFDRCGKLMPGRRDEVRQRLDAYLAVERKDLPTCEGSIR